TSNTVGGMFGLFLTEADKVSNFEQVTQCNVEGFKTLFHGMLDEGVYLAPSAYEAGFVSIMHTDDDIQASINAAAKVLGKLK
ncbi:MAG: aspartate aminotransferase family protein, partial [Gammaproteobacteria bacterium]|nr:aspartate aminotransferase family protein [Gammaproteobacteria bacterium]